MRNALRKRYGLEPKQTHDTLRIETMKYTRVRNHVLGLAADTAERVGRKLILASSRLVLASKRLKILQEALAYQGAEEDIFIVSYPKSGTTWVQMILYQLTSDGSMNIPHIDLVSPHFEETLFLSGQRINDLKSPRRLKSHLPYASIPKGPGRYIYVLRDGRDVAVSYFHQLSRQYQSFESFFEDFVHGKVPYGSWFSHVAKWLCNGAGLRLHIVRFEHLITDLAAGVREIAGFCGICTDEQILERTVRNCTFDSMRRYEPQFSLSTRDHARFADRPRMMDEPLMIRKGQMGAWHEYFTSEMLTKYRDVFRRLPRDTSLADYEL